MENLINWKMFVDKKTDLCYIQNIADEWFKKHALYLRELVTKIKASHVDGQG